MKVLFTNEAPLIKYGLAEGFRQAGHEAYVIMGAEDRLWGKPAEEQICLINKALDKADPDLVFIEGYCGLNIEKVLPEIKKRNIPIFYWAIEDPVTPHIADAHIPYADYIFTTTIERVAHYRRRGVASNVLLFACNPEIHKNVGIHEEFKHDIVLVASNYSNRYEEAEWFVLPLLNAGYDIKIWGLWWDDDSRPVNINKYPGIYGGVLPYEDLNKVYSSAKIVLAMNCDDTSKTQSSMRPYETMGCGGGIYLGHYTQAVQNIFGYNAWQAKNAKETKNMVDFLLNTSAELRKFYAEQAQKLVYAEHTYKQRAELIVDTYYSFMEESK